MNNIAFNEFARVPVSATLKEALPEPFIDVVSSSVTYQGYAKLGVGEEDEGWRLIKFEKTGNVTKALYPNGDSSFNFKWSDRASYTYTR